jgi:hypothetical protein
MFTRLNEALACVALPWLLGHETRLVGGGGSGHCDGSPSTGGRGPVYTDNLVTGLKANDGVMGLVPSRA